MLAVNDVSKSGSSTLYGTDDREASPRRWLIALVQMHCEKQVSHRLSRLQIENFVPVQREIHNWSDRRKPIDRIVIPMAVFLHVSDEELRSIRDYSFIYRLMSYPGELCPAAIPDEQVDRFRQMLLCAEADVSIEAAPLEVGDSVRITKGSLRNLCGELAATADNKSHVIVRIGCLGCASIDLPSDYVERLPQRR